MTRHTLSPTALAALIALMTGCSDFGAALDPYADMDADNDMTEVITPDIPVDLAVIPVDESADTPDLTQPGPDMPIIMELPVPKELQAVPESTGITLTWLPARGALRYEVRINGGPWKSTGTEMQFVHEDAPGGTVTSATITASDMTERPHVALKAEDILGEPGPEQTYEVRAIHEDGASTPSEPTTAQRPFEVDTITWERQDEGSTDWQPLPAATGDSTLDTTAAPEGNTHTYRALITPIASDTFTSTDDAGARLAAVQVLGSLYHYCALLNDGSVRCWGDNRFGQLGLNNKSNITQDPSAYPLKPSKLPEKIKQIGVGAESVCALSFTDELYCWGKLADREFQYTESNGNMYAEKILQTDVKSIPRSYVSHLCYITTSDDLKCFGSNSKGQLGYENTLNLASPESQTVPLTNTVISVEHSIAGTCALLTNNNVTCWGYHPFINNGETIGDESGEMPPPLISGTGIDNQITQISLNLLTNACFLVGNKASYCWGNAINGQLGSNSLDDTPAPGVRRSTLFENAGLVEFFQISTGLYNVCVLTDTAQVYCWGTGQTGINGNGRTEHIGDDDADRLTPVNLGGNASQIDTSGGVACALSSGEVLCWGDNTTGQLGRSDITLSEVIGDEPGEMPPQPVQLW